MNRIALLTFALAAAATSAVAVAQQPIPSARTHPASMDTNHDGVIDRAEAATNPRFAARFDQLDRNHDGRLSRDERPHWSGHGGHHGSGGIARMDANGDGRIAREEITGNGRHQETLAAKFAEIDGNHDGYLVR